MRKKIIEVLKYFAFFSYPPTLDEIYTFLPVKTSKKQLKSELEKLKPVEKNLLKTQRYTMVGYSNFFIKKLARERNSQKKINSLKTYLKLISLFPQIKLVGLSGTVAMMNAKGGDDIDLFIITSRGRLWTGRFVALLLAQILGIRRKRGERQAKDKICPNLFFDEKNLKIVKNKQTFFVAHELLQMKTLINKEGIVLKLFDANRWVFDLFPNAKLTVKNLKFKTTKQNSKLTDFKLLTLILNFSLLTFNLICEWVELLLKKFQLSSIKKHQTREIISDSQLWFFPEDFEEKPEVRQVFQKG